MPLFDEKGKEIEGALTPEEVQELQKKVETFEESQKQIEELNGKLKEKEEEFNKLSNKDYNFKRLREKSEEEVEEMKKKMNDREKILLDEVLEISKERDAEREARYKEAEKEILDSLAGGDDELREKIIAAGNELVGDSKTVNELESRLRKAYILAKGEAPRPSPLFSGYAASYREPDTKVKRFTDTEDGKEAMGKWFGKDVAGRIYKEKK